MLACVEICRWTLCVDQFDLIKGWSDFLIKLVLLGFVWKPNCFYDKWIAVIHQEASLARGIVYRPLIPSMIEAIAEESRVWGQPGLCKVTLSQLSHPQRNQPNRKINPLPLLKTVSYSVAQADPGLVMWSTLALYLELPWICLRSWSFVLPCLAIIFLKKKKKQPGGNTWFFELQNPEEQSKTKLILLFSTRGTYF